MSSSYNLRNRPKNSISNGQINSVNNSGESGQFVRNGELSQPSSKNHHSNLTATQKDEIESLVLWRRPFKTIYYAFHQSIELSHQSIKWIYQHKYFCLGLLLMASVFFGLLQLEGTHQPYVQYLHRKLIWCLYWVGLGILSSVGLGTGLHTFILYLGPHIASVTLAAYECNSLNFPEPPYPDEIICPLDGSQSSVTVWSIMSKVRLEAFMWGAGTALGELPPYFISKAHRLSGDNQDDVLEELEELGDLVPELEGSSDSKKAPKTNSIASQKKKSFGQRLKTQMILLMKRLGFFGILACASIPNPLFDLAGIICGYSLISFWTFFGATLIGKAIIKMHIQKLVVIIVFNEAYVQTVLSIVKNIPYIGQHVHGPLKDYFQQQQQSLHRGSDQILKTKSQSWISFLLEMFVIVMVTYFMVSIINSMAQSNLKQRLNNSNRKNAKKTNLSSSSKSSNNPVDNKLKETKLLSSSDLKKINSKISKQQSESNNETSSSQQPTSIKLKKND